MDNKVYNVVSEEIGYPKDNPYHSTEDKDEAVIICRLVSEKYDCWCIVIDENDFKWFAKGKFKR